MEMNIDYPIGVLVNGNSRMNRLQPITPEGVSAQLKMDAKVIVTKRVEEVRGALEELLSCGCKLLAVAGGDGTIHIILTELINLLGEYATFPRVLILRGGTMNIAASNLGTRRPPLMELRALSIALELKRKKQLEIPVRRTRPLKLETPGLSRPLYGFLFATGIAARILQEYYKGEPSPLRAVNVTTTVLLESFVNRKSENRFFKPVKSKIVLDGELYPSKDFKIAVATPLPRLLLWFSVFDESRGPLDRGFYFLANSMKTSAIAKNLWALSRGKYSGPGQVKGIFNKAEFESVDLFTVDGELYGKEGEGNKLTITSGPTMEFLDLSGIKLGRTLQDNFHYSLPSTGWIRTP